MTYSKGDYFYLPLLVMLAIHIIPICAFGQPLQHNGWHLGDLKRDKVMGTSANLAYEELLIGRKSVPVVVAVIDGGVDTNHIELSSVLWRNSGEIPGNGKDDDHNGYVDDVHGWNFLGSAKGSFQNDNYDMIRQLRQETKGSQGEHQLQISVNDSRRSIQLQLEASKSTLKAFEAIATVIGKPDPTLADFKNYHYRDYEEEQQLLLIVAALRYKDDSAAYRKHLQTMIDNATDELNYSLNINYNPRKEKVFSDAFNGNGDVEGPWAIHGTHVAGIIAGKTVGVARKNVQLMILRTVPTGDYLDGDMARAIRYAVDNGANVINISAGKSGAINPELIESSIRYAMEKDVLIVHASGNNGQLLEQGYFPRANYIAGEKAKAWIEVGASGTSNDSTLVLKASNFGKEIVNLFAPGVDIRSCSPGNGYSEQSGTSMAAPVVTGIAAVLRSYYPGFSADQVRSLILNSVQQIEYNILAPNGLMIPFKETCSAGGIANLYLAILHAGKLEKQGR